MDLTLSSRFAFELEEPSSALLQFEVAPMYGPANNQRLIETQTRVTACETFARVPAQDAIGERIWIYASGLVEVEYQAQVAITRALPPLGNLVAIPPHLLPGDTVKYLLDSRYCHSSEFIAFTQSQFGATTGGARVAAIRDWVAGHLAYAPGSSGPSTTATDVFHGGAGICRDFAHLFVTLARASAIPTRYVACYAPGVTPPDFHAVAEVFLADPGDDAGNGSGAGGPIGQWYMVDASGMAELGRAAIIGVGRDAGDVSFLTSFGPVRFLSSEVVVDVPGGAGWRGGDQPALALGTA